MKQITDKIRFLMADIQAFIDNGKRPVESQLKFIWNYLSDIVTVIESLPDATNKEPVSAEEVLEQCLDDRKIQKHNREFDYDVHLSIIEAMHKYLELNK